MDVFDVETWRQIMVDSITELATTVAAFLPSLLATVAILVVGWLVSKGVEIVAIRGLRRSGLDDATRRARLDGTLERAGIESPPSRIVARLLFWVLMLTFLVSAIETLGLTAVTSTIDRLIAFLPGVIAAGLILVVGVVLARFAGSVAGSAAAAANIGQAARVGRVVQGVLISIVAVLALGEIGVDTSVVVTVVSIVLGGTIVSLGVAFALGARPVISHILAGHFLRQSLTAGESVEIAGRRGTVERVGAVETVLHDGEQRWSLPNSRLLDEEIVR